MSSRAHPTVKALAWAPVLVLGLAACVSPARTSDQYRGKARTAIQAAAGEVSSGLLVVRQERSDKILTPVADEVVTSSETALGSISDAFGSVQPPDPSADDLRDDITGLLSHARDAMAHARIAVRRSDPDALTTSENELRKSAADLAAAEDHL